jgi:hypothetical protein
MTNVYDDCERCHNLECHLRLQLTTLAKAKARTNKTFIVKASLTIITHHRQFFIVQTKIPYSYCSIVRASTWINRHIFDLTYS